MELMANGDHTEPLGRFGLLLRTKSVSLGFIGNPACVVLWITIT